MKKILVAYFSCSGYTKQLAQDVAKKVNADLFEIIPAKIYTEEDLDWNNPNSRSSMEMNHINSRPEIAKKVENMEEYDTLYVGYPIWWGKAPTILNTFLESYDLTGKTIFPFATYHSSGIGESDIYLKPSCKNAIYKPAKGFPMNFTESNVDDWLKKTNNE